MTLVREPLVRFVASYKDKIERYNGEIYYYKLITAKILGTKYPQAMLPSSQTEWHDRREELGLELTFLNMVEWNLKLKLTGFNNTLRIECNQYKQGCFRTSGGRDGIRTVTIDWHFQPQVFNCEVCGMKEKDNRKQFVGKLERPEDVDNLYSLVDLEIPEKISKTKFNKHWTSTGFQKAKIFYDQIPKHILYNFIKMFEPDYLAFGYDLPFKVLIKCKFSIMMRLLQWLDIQTVNLTKKIEKKTIYTKPNLHSFKNYEN